MENKKETAFGQTVRDAFFNRLFELIQNGEDIIVLTPDLGAPSLDALREHYPQRYISVGIAEQNLISVAAGLALTGKRVVAYGLGPFPITRAFDQIRCLIAEMDIPVTLCTLNAGLCSAECGYTHMPVEDMGMLRMLPQLRTYNPTDETLARLLAEEVPSCRHPRVIRFDKYLRGTVYAEQEPDLRKGFIEYGTGGGLGVVSCGIYIPELRRMTENLLQDGHPVKLIDLFSCPADEERLLQALKDCQTLLTLEEHNLAGGIGSYILELLADVRLQIPIKRMGLRFDQGCYTVFADRTFIRQDQKTDMPSVREITATLLQEMEVRS